MKPACLLVPLAVLASTARAEAPNVRATPVSEAREYVPGAKVWIGVRFQLAPGWHIYWQNPGDNGMAPTVEWLLPDGFRVSALHWPVPARFGEAPSISYGHVGEVLLLAELSTPATPPPGGAARVGARVRWLVCRDVCVPGRADLEWELRSGARSVPNPPEAEAIARVRAGWPKPAASGMRAYAEAGAVVLVLDPPSADDAEAYFYAADPEVLDHSATQDWLPGERGRRLRLPLSSYGKELPARLRGVLSVSSRVPVHWAVDTPIENLEPQGEQR